MRTLLISAMCLLMASCQNQVQEKPKLTTNKDSVSYAIGLNIGGTFKQQSVDVDPQIVASGIRAGLADKDKMLTEQQVNDLMMRYQTQLMAAQEKKMKEQGDANRKKGQEFLEKNKSQAGVKVTPSGLQYIVLKEGTGPMPTAQDKVTTHYRGTTIDGKEFDSSYKRGQPATFPCSGVIRGWTEALQMMKVGSKWKLFIPSDLAYGERGAGQEIGPNEVLIFEIELLSIDKSADKPGKAE